MVFDLGDPDFGIGDAERIALANDFQRNRFLQLRTFLGGDLLRQTKATLEFQIPAPDLESAAFAPDRRPGRLHLVGDAECVPEPLRSRQLPPVGNGGRQFLVLGITEYSLDMVLPRRHCEHINDRFGKATGQSYIFGRHPFAGLVGLKPDGRGLGLEGIARIGGGINLQFARGPLGDHCWALRRRGQQWGGILLPQVLGDLFSGHGEVVESHFMHRRGLQIRAIAQDTENGADLSRKRAARDAPGPQLSVEIESMLNAGPGPHDMQIISGLQLHAFPRLDLLGNIAVVPVAQRHLRLADQVPLIKDLAFLVLGPVSADAKGQVRRAGIDFDIGRVTAERLHGLQPDNRAAPIRMDAGAVREPGCLQMMKHRVLAVLRHERTIEVQTTVSGAYAADDPQKHDGSDARLSHLNSLSAWVSGELQSFR